MDLAGEKSFSLQVSHFFMKHEVAHPPRVRRKKIEGCGMSRRFEKSRKVK